MRLRNSQDIARDNNVPLYNLSYQESLTKAVEVPKVEVYFVRCKNCGFVFNCVYDQLDYQVYQNANGNSSKNYQKNLSQTADQLLYNINEEISTVIEDKIKSMNLNIEVINIFKQRKHEKNFNNRI